MMSNPDNIANALDQGSAKAAAQEQTEVVQQQSQTATAQVDKISPAEQTSEDQGLVGGARNTGPVTVAETASAAELSREEKFGPAVASAVASINRYEQVMARNARVTTDVIDEQQAVLFNALNTIVGAADSGDFMGGMEFLFRKFRENKTGAFGGDTVRRRVNYMKKPSGDKALNVYCGFIDLLQVFSDPKGRKVLWSRFNKMALEFAPAGEKRQRLEVYMQRICA